MLMACNGMIVIYTSIHNGEELDTHKIFEEKQMLSQGLFFVWIFMLGLRCLDTDYLSKLQMAFASVKTPSQCTFRGSSHCILESSSRNVFIALCMKIVVAILHLTAYLWDVPTARYVGVHAVLMAVPVILELCIDMKVFLDIHYKKLNARMSIAKTFSLRHTLSMPKTKKESAAQPPQQEGVVMEEGGATTIRIDTTSVLRQQMPF